jgi:flagellar assembly factor FliW
MPEILTKYFGSIEYSEADVVQFSSGLPAFEDETQFLLIEPPARAPIVFLQSLRHSNLCFLTLPILVVDPEYHLAVAGEDLVALGLDPARRHQPGAEITCLAVVAVAENGLITANLLAPLVINRAQRCGLQAIRIDSAYSHVHPVAGFSGDRKEDLCS